MVGAHGGGQAGGGQPTTVVPGRTRRRPIVLVTHSYFEEDPRLRRQAEAILAAGREVDVIALRRPSDSARATVDGARVTRIDVRRHQGAGAGTYLMEYLSFFVAVTWRLALDHRRRHYALAQVATLPDWLVFAALPLRLVGVPVVLDLHEAMPQFFAMRFPRLARAPIPAIMRIVERCSIAAASSAITVNAALRDRLVDGGVRPSAVSIVPNTPSLRRFDPGRLPKRAFMADGTLRLVYAGALTPTYELDVVLQATARIAAERPDLPVELRLYGRGDQEPALRTLAGELGLAARVRFLGRIPVEEMPAAIAGADIGLAPTRLDAFTRSSLSTKIFEYAAMAKPVVCSRLPLVERELPPAGVDPYTPGDPGSLARRILDLVDDPALREARVAAMRTHVTEHAWERDAVDYLALLERLARA